MSRGRLPRGAVADHWTNRAAIGEPAKWEVTGWHMPVKRGKAKAEPEPPVVARGLVATSVTKPTSRAKAMRERQGQLL